MRNSLLIAAASLSLASCADFQQQAAHRCQQAAQVGATADVIIAGLRAAGLTDNTKIAALVAAIQRGEAIITVGCVVVQTLPPAAAGGSK